MSLNRAGGEEKGEEAVARASTLCEKWEGTSDTILRR